MIFFPLQCLTSTGDSFVSIDSLFIFFEIPFTSRKFKRDSPHLKSILAFLLLLNMTFAYVVIITVSWTVLEIVYRIANFVLLIIFCCYMSNMRLQSS